VLGYWGIGVMGTERNAQRPSTPIPHHPTIVQSLDSVRTPAILSVQSAVCWLKRRRPMTRIELPLSEMTLAQKLDMMEALWADLSRDDKSVKSPPWHKAVLARREAAVRAGTQTFADWEEAKRRIRERVR